MPGHRTRPPLRLPLLHGLDKLDHQSLTLRPGPHRAPCPGRTDLWLQHLPRLPRPPPDEDRRRSLLPDARTPGPTTGPCPPGPTWSTPPAPTNSPAERWPNRPRSSYPAPNPAHGGAIGMLSGALSYRSRSRSRGRTMRHGPAAPVRARARSPPYGDHRPVRRACAQRGPALRGARGRQLSVPGRQPRQRHPHPEDAGHRRAQRALRAWPAPRPRSDVLGRRVVREVRPRGGPGVRRRRPRLRTRRRCAGTRSCPRRRRRWRCPARRRRGPRSSSAAWARRPGPGRRA